MSAFCEHFAQRLLALGNMNIDPHARLAEVAEGEAQRYVAALVPEEHLREVVLSSEELTQYWPPAVGAWWYDTPESESLRQTDALVRINGNSSTRWHPDVTRNEIVEALRILDDETAKWLAELLRAGGATFLTCSPLGLLFEHVSRWFSRSYAVAPHHADDFIEDIRFQPESSTEPYPQQNIEADIVDLRRAIEFVRGPNWWDIQAVAAVLAVAKRVREKNSLESSPLAAARFAFRNVAELTRDEPQALAKRQQVVADAMRIERGKQDDPLFADPSIERELERELRHRIEDMRNVLGFDGPPPETEQEACLEEGGILAYDARLARYLERIGDRGKTIAGNVHRSAKERGATHRRGTPTHGQLLELWADTNTAPIGCRFAKLLARALLRDVIITRLRKPPALAVAMHEPIMHLLSRQRQREEKNGQTILRLQNDTHVRVRQGHAPATIEADTLNAIMVNRGLDLFGSVAAHRVLRHQIFTAHAQVINGNPDPRVVRIEGGWSAYAHDILGMKGNKAADQVRDIVEAEHACEVPLPPNGTYSRLLIREMVPARGQKRGRITLVLGTALLPDYVHELKRAMGKTLEAKRATKLVPVLELPPFVGRDNEHGPQATLSMAAVAFLRDRAPELAEEGGVLFDLDAFATLARGAGVPAGLVRAVLDRWTQDGDDGPAFLKTVAPNRYTLGDRHAAARAFLEEGGRDSIERSRAGQLGVARRRATLSRGGQRK